jgi:soluble lytic murein transglycosylase
VIRQRKVVSIVVSLFFLTGVSVTALTLRHASAEDPLEKNAVLERIVVHLKGKDVRMHDDKLRAVVDTVYEESLNHDIDYRLALAVIKVESNFKPGVVSKKGAQGLFQIKPSLARYIAKDAGVAFNGADCLKEPDKNIKLGIYHLSRLVENFRSLPTALNAYNMGETRVRARQNGKGQPKNAFTKRVLKEYQNNISMLPEVEGTR